MKYIEILFVNYYKFQLKVGNKDVAVFYSILMIVLVLSIYFLSVLSLGHVFFPGVISTSGIFGNIGILFYLTLLSLLIVRFLHKKKYKSILKKEEYKEKGKYATIIFTLMSFASLALSFVIMILQKQGKL